MPETPKSFEQCHNNCVLLAGHTGDCMMGFLPPQTAPGSGEWVHVEIKRPDEGYEDVCDELVAEDALKDIGRRGWVWRIAAARQAASPDGRSGTGPEITVATQTAVGEGELPPLDVTGEDWERYHDDINNGDANKGVEVYCRERQFREAIAQRDGARERLQKVGGRLLFLESVCGFPKTVALGDEELEKLRGQVFNMLVCYKGVRDAWGDDRTVEIEALLARLRSQDGNQEGQ